MHDLQTSRQKKLPRHCQPTKALSKQRFPALTDVAHQYPIEEGGPIFVHNSKGAIEEDCPPFANEFVDPEQPNTT